MHSEPGQSDMATDAELLTIKGRFAPVPADAAQAIVEEAMSPASKAERRIAPTEVKHILEGIDRGVISFEANRIRFANDPLRVCSLFALNREYFLQISAFISLMADYRYPADRCKFEYDKLDVCVFKDNLPWIYGETKASQREAELLLDKITNRYGPTAASFSLEIGRGNDALQKVKQIHKYPSLEYFWLVTPLKQWSFRIVRISDSDGSLAGFSLEPVSDIPHHRD